MTRLRGRAPKGERLIGKMPHGHWKLSTFIAALRNDWITAPMVIDRPMNGEIFLAYVLTFLLPTLSKGDIVVMEICRLTRLQAWSRRLRASARGSCICRPTPPI